MIKMAYYIFLNLKNKKKSIFFCLSFSLIGNVFIVLAPMFLAIVIDEITGQLDNGQIILYLLLTALFYVIGTLLNYLCQIFAANLSSELISNLRKDSLKTVLYTPIKNLDKKNKGDILSRFMGDIDAVYDASFQLFTHILPSIVIIILSSIIMITLNGYLFLIVLLMSPVIYLASKKVSKNASNSHKEVVKTSGLLSNKVIEATENYRLIKAYNYNQKTEEDVLGITELLKKDGKKALFFSALVNPTTRLVNNFTYVLLGLFGILLIIDGNLSIGYLTEFFIYAGLFAKPINEFAQIYGVLVLGNVSINKILDLTTEEKLEYQKVQSNNKVDGAFLFSNVTFSYTDKPLIENFNAAVKAKEKIAIVGPTGAGKSTIINLLLRFYELDSGTIELDGNNISNMDIRDLRKNFGLVLQNTWLFKGTIRENISYAKEDATLEEVIEAAKIANCHEFILSLNNGYDEIVKDNMSNISLGERQLITIARAVLAKPSIFILDEATSNIDSLTEAIINKTFNDIMINHTSFIIAHRLSSIIDANLIIVINDGKIIESGTHNELLELDGFYKKLYISNYES